MKLSSNNSAINNGFRGENTKIPGNLQSARLSIPGNYYSSSKIKYCPAGLPVAGNYWLLEHELSGKILKSPAITSSCRQ